jgi:hypothetical protein
VTLRRVPWDGAESGTSGFVTPMGVISTMPANPIPVTVHRHGGSLCLVLVKAVRELLPWRAGDVIAVRVCGDKLVMERIPLETLAKVRTGEPIAYAAPQPEY